MITSRQIRRTQKLLLLLAAGLAVFYGVVYRPFAEKSRALDKPLQLAWKKLNSTEAKNDNANVEQLDLFRIEERLRKKQKELGKLQQAERTISAQLALDPVVRAKMHEPFQLVDFQIEELGRIENLTRLAEQNRVSLSPSLALGYPEYTADKAQPELLWAQLYFLDHLLSTAVRNKVSLIQNIELSPFSGHHLSTTNSPFIYEIPLRVEIVGSMETVSRFLASLPMRETSGQTNSVANGQPPLFIHRFILKKSSPENPDEVHLDLRACGFVYPD